MNKFDVKWLKDIGIFLLSLLSEIGMVFSKLGDWLINNHPLFAAISQFTVMMIFLIYFFKIFFFNFKIPIIENIIRKIKNAMGVKNKNVMAIDMVESGDNGTVIIEKRMKRLKSLSDKFIYLMKKGKGTMKKLFTAIGKFFYHNKITITGWLALLVAVGACAIRTFKPELIVKLISDKELIAGVISLVMWTSYAVFGHGIENQEAWNKRHEEKWAEDAVRKEQNAKLRDELQKNKLIKVIKKEIETNIIPILQERLLQEAKSGILSNYRSITKLFPQLYWEYIVEDLGGDPVKIDELLAQLDELARNYNLIEVKNGVEVNLITEELKKVN